MTTAAWLFARTAGAPPALAARVQAYLERVPPNASNAARLAGAARLALDAVIAQGHARSAALDLLTADSLLTLALLSQAEEAPDGLGCFAAELIGSTAA